MSRQFRESEIQEYFLVNRIISLHEFHIISLTIYQHVSNNMMVLAGINEHLNDS